MDYLITKYCDMLIEVSTELKEGKRELNESIDLIQMFGKNLEPFKKPKL